MTLLYLFLVGCACFIFAWYMRRTAKQCDEVDNVLLSCVAVLMVLLGLIVCGFVLLNL